MVIVATVDTNKGMRYDEARQFLLVQGVVARKLHEHVLVPRPKRDSRAAAFDELADNTTLGIHMSEIRAGGDKRGHRHVDEALIYIVSGEGWSELRQSDEKSDQRVDWKTGDLISIPANAWHQHFNGLDDQPTRQLAFKNTRMLRRLFNSRDFVYANDFRFHDRYDDEGDYWTIRERQANGKLRTNVISNCLAEQLTRDESLGIGVSIERYQMGGHLMLENAIVEIEPGGHVRAHRHLAEEGLLILTGSGRTLLWNENGPEKSVRWQAGDLICPPLNVWHQHVADSDAQVRYLAVKNNFIELALGVKSDGLDTPLPDRFPYGDNEEEIANSEQ